MLPSNETFPIDKECVTLAATMASVAELFGAVALLVGAADELDVVYDELNIASLLLDGVVDTGLRSSPRTSMTFSA